MASVSRLAPWGGPFAGSVDTSGKQPAPGPTLPDFVAHIVGGIRHPVLQLWDQPEAAPGSSVLAHIGDLLDGSEVERVTRGTEGALKIVAPTGAAWLESASLGKVIRLWDPVLGTDAGELFTPSSTEEWRVRSIRRVDGPRDEAVQIIARPIIQDLTECGPIYKLVDGAPMYAIGEVELSLNSAWEDYIEPFLADLGIDWWTVSSSATVLGTFNLTNVTPLGLLIQLAEAQDPARDVWVEHQGSDPLRIHMSLRAFEAGASSQTRKLNVSRDDAKILGFREEQAAERWATAAVAVREAVPGGTGSVGLRQLAFEVTDVTGSVVELGNHGPSSFVGAGLLFDDMLKDRYLVKTDGTLTEITGSDGNDVTVADPTGITVGDIIEIVRNADGDPVHEATNPALLAEHRRTVTINADGKGRNYATNPWFRDWPTSGYQEAFACQVGSGGYTGSSLSLPLKHLPASTTIPDGSVVVLRSSGGNAGFATTVDGDQDTSGSGTITLTLDAAASPGAEGEGTNVVIFFAPELADRWSPVWDGTEDPTGQYTPLGVKRDADAETSDLTGAVASSASFFLGSTSGDPWHIDLKGLTAGAVIQPGDVIVHTSTGDGLVNLRRVTVDGAGEVTCQFYPTDSGTAVSVDDAVTVKRPAFGSPWGDDQLVTWALRVDDVTNAGGWTSDALFVPFVEGWSLRARAVFAVYNATGSGVTVTPSGTVSGLRVAIQDASLGVDTDVASTEDAERTYPSREVETVELTVDHEPSSGASYRVRVEGVHRETQMLPDLTIALVEVSLSYGPSAYTLEGVEKSGTSAVFSRLSGALLGLRSPRSIEVQVKDRAYDARATDATEVAREKIVLGAPWFLVSGPLGLDARVPSKSGSVLLQDGLVRVMRTVQSLTDPRDTKVTLDHDVFRLSEEG